MVTRKSSPKGTKKKNVTENSGNSVESIAALSNQMGVTAAERHQLVSKAAYLRAERRGFMPGAEMEDWLEAEAEVDRMLQKKAADNQSQDA